MAFRNTLNQGSYTKKYALAFCISMIIYPMIKVTNNCINNPTPENFGAFFACLGLLAHTTRDLINIYNAEPQQIKTNNDKSTDNNNNHKPAKFKTNNYRRPRNNSNYNPTFSFAGANGTAANVVADTKTSIIEKITKQQMVQRNSMVAEAAAYDERERKKREFDAEVKADARAARRARKGR